MNYNSCLRILSIQRFLIGKYIFPRVTNLSLNFYKRNFTSLLLHSRKANVPSLTCLCDFTRTYAKGKDKKKADSKGKKKVTLNEDELSEVIQLDSMKNQMQKALDGLRDEYIKNVSLRSSAGAVEGLKVKLDGQEHTLQELAQVVRKNPKTIVINMSSFPQAIPAVLQAIQTSGMNLNPQQDGTTLYIPVPMVTKEHRENLAKNAKVLFIKCRDNVKDVQSKFLKTAKKRTDMSEDTVFAAQQQIIAHADQFVGQAEKMMQAKHQELLGKD